MDTVDATKKLYLALRDQFPEANILVDASGDGPMVEVFTNTSSVAVEIREQDGGVKYIIGIHLFDNQKHVIEYLDSLL